VMAGRVPPRPEPERRPAGHPRQLQHQAQRLRPHAGSDRRESFGHD
jgi:hypothetical protein